MSYQSRPLTPQACYAALAEAFKESNLSADHGLALLELTVTYGADGAFDVLENMVRDIQDAKSLPFGCTGPALSCENETPTCGVPIPTGGYTSRTQVAPAAGGGICDPVRLATALSSPTMVKKAAAMQTAFTVADKLVPTGDFRTEANQKAMLLRVGELQGQPSLATLADVAAFCHVKVALAAWRSTSPMFNKVPGVSSLDGSDFFAEDTEFGIEIDLCCSKIGSTAPANWGADIPLPAGAAPTLPSSPTAPALPAQTGS